MGKDTHTHQENNNINFEQKVRKSIKVLYPYLVGARGKKVSVHQSTFQTKLCTEKWDESPKMFVKNHYST